MTQVLSSTTKAKQRFRFWAASGGPVGLWSMVSKGGRELTWVLAGKFALMGANAVLMLFLANRLDLKTYGLLVITISGQLLISRLLMVGVDAGMMRLTALPELRSRYPEVITAGLVVMIRSSVALLVVLFVALPVLYQFEVPGWAFACIAGGSIGTALVDYGYSFRLARQEYPLAAVAQGGTALSRLGLTTVAAITLVSHPVAAFVAYHGVSLVSGLFQTSLIARANWQRPDRELIKRLLRYSFWQGKANVIVIFCLYQGTFLLMFLKQPADTGVFGLGLTLSLGFFAIYNAYFEYLLARIRSVVQLGALPRFTARSLLGALILVIACVPIVFSLAKLIPWLLGPQWSQVVAIFVYLSASMTLLILQAPLEAACHYMLKPQLISFGWASRAALIAVAGIILAPRMGALGAAIAQLIGTVLALVVLGLLVLGTWRSATSTQR